MPASNAAWFVDAAGLDFRPGPKSPLLAAGKPADSPQAPDAGAYQRNEAYWIPGRHVGGRRHRPAGGDRRRCPPRRRTTQVNPTMNHQLDRRLSE